MLLALHQLCISLKGVSRCVLCPLTQILAAVPIGVADHFAKEQLEDRHSKLVECSYKPTAHLVDTCPTGQLFPQDYFSIETLHPFM